MKKMYNPNKRLGTSCVVLPLLLLFHYSLSSQCIEGSCQDGEGIFVFDNGQRYVGQFSNGRIEGEGALYYPSGDRYLGSFLSGRPHGEGVLIHPDGSRQVGIWSFGQLRQGEEQSAELTSRGGGQTGCISGDCENGHGTYLSVGGAIYVGEFQNGEIHGQGVCYYADGSKYQGNGRIGILKARARRPGQAAGVLPVVGTADSRLMTMAIFSILSRVIQVPHQA